MNKEDLDYLLRDLRKVNEIARLGVDSQNNMEQVLFRRIYDDSLTLQRTVHLHIRTIEKAETDTTESKVEP
jgi:hypothetical protein